jgi:hypothetical protein
MNSDNHLDIEMIFLFPILVIYPFKWYNSNILIKSINHMTKRIIFILATILVAGILFLAGPAISPLHDQPTAPPSVERECPALSYGLDCSIVSFLEKELAWTNKDGAKAFCAYGLIGESGNEKYLKAFCSSFYVLDKETVCPEEESEKCFLSRDCSGCTERGVTPRIVQDSGISIPIKLTIKDSGYVLDKPSDGSSYGPSMLRIFPKDIIGKIESDKGDISSIAIGMAEDHFKVMAKFDPVKELGQSCNTHYDCASADNADVSVPDCPKSNRCVDNKCMVGCYDFIDHQYLPIKE